jgi:hypothetical protein
VGGGQSTDTSDPLSKKFWWGVKVIRKSRRLVKCRLYGSPVVLPNVFVERLWAVQLVWEKKLGRVKGKIDCQYYVDRFRYNVAILWTAVNLNFIR